jgi:hypothetical protein
MEHYVEENVVARLFLGIEGHLAPHVRDHSNIARAQASLGVAGRQEVNDLLVSEATRLGFGQVEIASSDTTVQEPVIGYPKEAGIMRGVAQRLASPCSGLSPPQTITKAPPPVRHWSQANRLRCRRD